QRLYLAMVTARAVCQAAHSPASGRARSTFSTGSVAATMTTDIRTFSWHILTVAAVRAAGLRVFGKICAESWPALWLGRWCDGVWGKCRETRGALERRSCDRRGVAHIAASR